LKDAENAKLNPESVNSDGEVSAKEDFNRYKVEDLIERSWV
jgi:hypothetical protein